MFVPFTLISNEQVFGDGVLFRHEETNKVFMFAEVRSKPRKTFEEALESFPRLPLEYIPVEMQVPGLPVDREVASYRFRNGVEYYAKWIVPLALGDADSFKHEDLLAFGRRRFWEEDVDLRDLFLSNYVRLSGAMYPKKIREYDWPIYPWDVAVYSGVKREGSPVIEPDENVEKRCPPFPFDGEPGKYMIMGSILEGFTFKKYNDPVEILYGTLLNPKR